MKTYKKGISLIVLVITITSTYDEANKIDKIPPKSKIEIMNKLEYENKVVGSKFTTLHF